MSRPRRALSLGVVISLAAGVLGVTSLPSGVSAAGGLGAGGEFHPTNKTVIFDARNNSKVGPSAPLASNAKGKSVELSVTGKGGVPPMSEGVLAVALSIRVKGASVPGELVAYAGDIRRIPSSATTVFGPNAISTVFAIVRPSATGTIRLGLRSDSATTANVRVVVVGWVSTSSSDQRGSRLVPLPPKTLFDSSTNTLTGREVVSLQVRGEGKVPADASVEAVMLNMTLNNTRKKSKSTFLAFTSTMRSRPGIGVVHAEPGEVESSVIIVPIGPDGKIHLYNKAGRTDATVQVVGYTRLGALEKSAAGRIVPLDRPFRSFDTRRDDFGSVPIGPGQAEDWDYAPFVDSLTYPDSGDLVGEVSTVLGTVSAVLHQRQYPANPPSSTEMRFYPTASKLPTTSNLFVSENQTRSNFIVGRLSSDDRMRAYNSNGTTHYMFDISAVVLQGVS